MAAPSDEDLILAAREIVFGARKDGRLEQVQHLTSGLIRERIEDRFKVPSGSLKPRKKIINDAIEAAIEADDDDVEMVDAKEEQDEVLQSAREVTPTSKKEKQKAKEQASDNTDRADGGSHAVSESESVSQKKPSKKTTSTNKKMPNASTKLKRADKNTTNFVNMLGLGAGGDEQAATMLMGGLGAGGPNKRVEMKSDSEFSVLEDGPPKKKTKRVSKDKNDAKPKRKGKETAKAAESSGMASASERSVMDDDAPAKTTKTTKKKREPKAEKVEDKDEAEIKRLKQLLTGIPEPQSFVVACGVRKKWAKEFEGLSKPSQQINHVKRILSDLGMTGRLSLEKAKEIREKRELAKEIEDVKEFDAKVNGPRASRSSTSKTNSRKVIVSASEDAGDEEEVDSEEVSSRPAKRKPNKSILAFLDGQSSD
ncbi:hypothetical protein FRB98_006773 [Tulasnella sp. 332]|nr:hypothetical protein FRB98_006773 [Tulasnella sp. 332]